MNAAKLEVQQATAMCLLQRYKDGLRDGASLSSGHGMGMGAQRATPDSAAGLRRQAPAVLLCFM